MTQKSAVLALLLALILSACGGESSLPVATGKGSIRAINAIASAPEVSFLIEERSIGAVEFRQATSGAPATADYDDLVYNFNFEAFYAGNSSLTRVATRNLDVVADTDYMMVLTGTLANPSILLWESPKRTFTGTETVFEAKFAHTSDSLGSVDYYFAAPGTAPVLGEEIGTLTFGEILTAADYAAGDYVLTITTSGDPTDILFESETSTYLAANQYTITSFDGGPTTFAPYIARAFPATLNAVTLADANYPATVEFVNGSLQLGAVDIYDDELQTSLIVDDLAHKAVSAELNLAAGSTDISITPFDANNPLLIEETLSFFTGVRGRVVAVGASDALQLVAYSPDRQGVETSAKLQLFSATSNFSNLTIYAVEAGAVLDDQAAIFAPLSTGNATQGLPLVAGSYDIYVREFLGTENLAGPVRIDVALGDVVGAVIFDNVDPAIVDLEILPNNL